MFVQLSSFLFFVDFNFLFIKADLHDLHFPAITTQQLQAAKLCRVN